MASSFVPAPKKEKKTRKKIERTEPKPEVRSHFLIRHGWKVSIFLFMLVILILLLHPFFVSYIYALSYASKPRTEKLKKLEIFAKRKSYLLYFSDEKFTTYAWLVRNGSPEVVQAALLSFGRSIGFSSIFFDKKTGVRSFRYLPFIKPYDFGQISEALMERIPELPDNVAILGLQFLARSVKNKHRQFVFTQKKRMLGKKNPLFRGRYMNALLAADGKKAGPIIAGLTESETPLLRAQALRYLGKTPDPDNYVSLLIKGLEDKSPDVREAAVRSLGKTASPKARLRLLKYKEEVKNPRMAEMIDKALMEIEDKY